MSAVVLELSVIEAAHLSDLVAQFQTLLDGPIDDERMDDPALARLVPDAYRDDVDAASEFRRLTQDDLLDRRRDDAATVAATLLCDGEILRPDAVTEENATDEFEITLDDAAVSAWLRTLTALRLVLATRLGIADDTDRLDHPRFGIYNWLGYRLEGLLEAIDD